jgi:Collagen triple helix repeat (20 copies)
MRDRLGRLRVSHATFVAAILIVAVAGGSAAAATDLMSARESAADPAPAASYRDFREAARATMRGLRGHTGPRGRRGHTGPQGATGAQGPQGATGAEGQRGATGDPASLSRLPWGVIGRNTTGSPSAYFRVGPRGRSGGEAADVPPPFGDGSLGLHVEGVNGTGSLAEKLQFGDETSFAGRPLAGITNIAYAVFTAEDTFTGHGLPTFTMEVHPDANGAIYSTLVYLPDASAAPSAPAPRTVNTWQRYDALAAGNKWFSTADLAVGTTLCQSVNACTFSELQAQLGPNAHISFSLGVTKGRDNEFTGAVDGIEFDGTIYDFEPEGVRALEP